MRTVPIRIVSWIVLSREVFAELYARPGKQTGDPAANAKELQSVVAAKGCPTPSGAASPVAAANCGLTVLAYTPAQDTNRIRHAEMACKYHRSPPVVPQAVRRAGEKR